MVTTKSLNRTRIENKAFIAILQGKVSMEGLARILRVSRSTAARLVASLRKKGIQIISVRENGAWHYEVRNALELAQERWEMSRLLRMAGFAKGTRPAKLKPEDAEIYGTG